MNQSLTQHLIDTLSKGFRVDGRTKEQIRPIQITTGHISTADGSAQVKFGDTEVIAGIKLAVEKPFPDTPEDGVLMVNLELLPMSNPKYESGPPGIDSIELSRVIDRGIRESRCLDTKSLCIAKGEKVWSVMIDISPINDDGNLMDVSAFAALLALKNTTFPEYDGEKVHFEKRTDRKLTLKHEPLPVTIRKIGQTFLVDPTEEEDSVMDARLTLTFLEDGKLCAAQKGGNEPLLAQDIDEMIALAEKVQKELRKHIPR